MIPTLIEKLSKHNIIINAAPEEEPVSPLLYFIFKLVAYALIYSIWIFFMRQMQGGRGGALGFGKSKQNY